MRLPPEMEAELLKISAQEAEDDAAQNEIIKERMRATGEPIREEYPNRTAFRTAYSKWKRDNR